MEIHLDEPIKTIKFQYFPVEEPCGSCLDYHLHDKFKIVTENGRTYEYYEGTMCVGCGITKKMR